MKEFEIHRIGATIISVAIAYLFLSLAIQCSHANNNKEATSSHDLNPNNAITLNYKDFDKHHLNIYIIDSCEYIGKINGLSDDIITHKGNCRFCEERKNRN